MIEINLLPPEFRRKEKREKKAFKVPELPYLRIIGIIFLVLIVVELLLFGVTTYVGGRVAAKEVELKKLNPDFERIKSVKLETLRTELAIKKLDEMTFRPFYWTLLLNAVSDSLTDNVWLTQVVSERKVIVFDLPDKQPERKPKAKVKTKAEDAASKKATKVKESKPRPVREVRTVKKTGKRIEHCLIIHGSAPVSGQGTASIGKFIQSLKENVFMKTIIQNANLQVINSVQDREGKTLTFDFTVVCLLKVPYSDALDPA